jgi:NAD(P)-dependent dehydrogenase (short-subunit alcohol dehydrogenase family)
MGGLTRRVTTIVSLKPQIISYYSVILCIILGLWVFINNAAIYGAGDIEFSPLEEYRRLAEVNLFGLVRVTKKFIPLVRQSKG